MLDEQRHEKTEFAKGFENIAEAALCEWLDRILTDDACLCCKAFCDYPSKRNGWSGGPNYNQMVHRCADGGQGKPGRILKQEIVLPDYLQWRIYNGILGYAGPIREQEESDISE